MAIAVLGHSLEQGLGVGVAWGGEQVLRAAFFHNLPGVHHRYALRHFTHHAHVVCDEH
jgi:hypothetical protein